MTIRRGRVFALASAAMISTLLLANPAAAQDKGSVPAPVIIVIDLQEVVKQSTAGKAIIAQRDKYLQQYQAEFSKQEDSLRDAEKELTRQRTLVSPEAFADKRQAFEKKVVEAQRKAQERRRGLEQSFGKAMSELNQTLIKVSDELAQESGANIVLAKNQVFLHDSRMEYTKAAIERLNKRLPAVDFPEPGSVDKDAKKPAKK